MVLDVEHDQVVVAEWIERTQDKCSGEGTEKRPPEGFEREVVTDLKEIMQTVRSEQYKTSLHHFVQYNVGFLDEIS